MQKKSSLLAAGLLASLIVNSSVVCAQTAAPAPAAPVTAAPSTGGASAPTVPATASASSAAATSAGAASTAAAGTPVAGADLTKLPKPSDKTDLTFDKDISPIFKASCVGCHGTVNAAGAPRQPSSKLDLTTLALSLKGGNQKDGKDIAPGHADQSLVVLYTGGAIATTKMPPRGTPLTADQVGLIMAWINQGAK